VNHVTLGLLPKIMDLLLRFIINSSMQSWRLPKRRDAAAVGVSPDRRKLQSRQRVGLDGSGSCARWQLPAIGANADSRRAAPRPGAQQTTGDRLLNKRRKFQFENGHGARGAKQRRLDPGRARAHRRGGQCRAAAESARRRRRGAAPAGRFGAMRVRCRMRRGAPARRVLADGSPYRGR